MALRRSTRKLGLSSRSRRKRGGGISIPTSTGSRLYDMDYRQMTEDYRDGIIAFDEYMNFLNNKLSGLAEGTHDYFTIEKRMKDITSSYNKKLESEYKTKATLQYSQITEDYRDGLIGYSVYSEYLSQRLETLDPNSLEFFTTQKKLDDITEQHIDKQMDFGFKVAKTIETDDYINFKKDILEGTEPGSNKFLEIQKDIKDAQWEKVKRSELKIKFDINAQTANKMDLAKFYIDTAQGTDDPEKQMLYYNRYASTMDSINSKALANYNKQISLEDRDMLLKFKRGDLGGTFEENLENYYNYLDGRLETEADVNKQFTLIGRIDSLVSESQRYVEQREKLGEKVAKEAQADAERKVKDQYYETKDNYFKQKNTLEKRLNSGNINSQKYAVEMIKLTEDYVKGLSGLAYNPNITEAVWEKIDTAMNKVNEHFETDAFWKSNIPVRDDKGNFTNEIFSNPNFKAIQKIDKAGNFKTNWEFDPTQSYQKEGYVYDVNQGVWREITERKTTNERGEEVITKEIYKQDESGNPIVEYQDSKTKQWGTLNEKREFVASSVKYRDADFGLMNTEDMQKYQQKTSEDVWKQVAQDAGTFGKLKTEAWKRMQSGGVMGVAATAMATSLEVPGTVSSMAKKAYDIVTTTSPTSFVRQKIPEAKEFLEKAKGIKIGDVGKNVEWLQRELKNKGLYQKGITGYLGPKTMQAVEKLQQQISPVVSKYIPKDVKKIGSAIMTGAKGLLQSGQIGGALGSVYAKRPDLQKAFTATGQGIGGWKGKTIQDWAKMYGHKEEVSLAREYGPKKTFTMPKFSLPELPSLSSILGKYSTSKWTKPISSRISGAIKDSTSKARSYIPKAQSFLEKTRQQAKKYLGKLKFW